MRLSFPPTLSQKKVRNLDLDCVQENLKAQKRLSSIHKVSQSEQVILFDALSPDQLFEITIMSILAHRISYLTHYKSN